MMPTFDLTWRVLVVKSDGKTTITMSSQEYPSRALAAQSLSRFGRCYIERNQVNRTYTVKPS